MSIPKAWQILLLWKVSSNYKALKPEHVHSKNEMSYEKKFQVEQFWNSLESIL